MPFNGIEMLERRALMSVVGYWANSEKTIAAIGGVQASWSSTPSEYQTSSDEVTLTLSNLPKHAAIRVSGETPYEWIDYGFAATAHTQVKVDGLVTADTPDTTSGDPSGGFDGNWVHQNESTATIKFSVTSSNVGWWIEEVKVELGIASVSFSSAETTEGGTVSLIVSRDYTESQPLTVSLGYSGTISQLDDLAAQLPTSITIPGGSASVFSQIAVRRDNLVEGEEWLGATILTDPTPVVIQTDLGDSHLIVHDDPPVVSVEVDNDEAYEIRPGEFETPTQDPIRFLFHRQGGDPASPLVISFFMAGSATEGSDYIQSPGELTFGAGETDTNLDIEVIDDILVEPTETVSVQISASPLDDTTDYLVNTNFSEATAHIVSNDTLLIAIAGHTQGGSNNVVWSGAGVSQIAGNFTSACMGQVFVFAEDPTNDFPLSTALCGDSFGAIMSKIGEIMAPFQAQQEFMPLAMVGYSHGGSLLYAVSHALAELEDPAYTLRFTGYIDAIDLGGTGAETRRPENSQYHYNIFQSRNDFLHGANTANTPANWDVDEESDVVSHIEIDKLDIVVTRMTNALIFSLLEI